MNAAIKYPGSKWSLADWIISYFPKHHSYLEPFFGGGAVLFNKPRSNIETINDLDSNVVNLFDCIRTDHKRFAQMIYMTPYARETYERACNEVSEDKFEKALEFCIKLNMGYGTRTNEERVGWKMDIQGRERAYASKNWCELPDKVIQVAERLRGVQIENRPAIELIERFNFDNVLIYCDPPYMLETRHGKQYNCEMSDKDHEDLLRVLIQHKGPAMISGYDSELYRDMLGNWMRVEKMQYSRIGSKKTEVLWMNFEPAAKQMTLEEFGESIF